VGVFTGPDSTLHCVWYIQGKRVRHDVDQATGLLKAELVGEEELEHRKKTQMVSCQGVSVSMVAIGVCAVNDITTSLL
jgi:hypothetical protein